MSSIDPSLAALPSERFAYLYLDAAHYKNGVVVMDETLQKKLFSIQEITTLAVVPSTTVPAWSIVATFTFGSCTSMILKELMLKKIYDLRRYDPDTDPVTGLTKDIFRDYAHFLTFIREDRDLVANEVYVRNSKQNS
jgi:hypothetical protein